MKSQIYFNQFHVEAMAFVINRYELWTDGGIEVQASVILPALSILDSTDMPVLYWGLVDTRTRGRIIRDIMPGVLLRIVCSLSKCSSVLIIPPCNMTFFHPDYEVADINMLDGSSLEVLDDMVSDIEEDAIYTEIMNGLDTDSMRHYYGKDELGLQL